MSHGIKTRIETPLLDQSIAFYTQVLGMHIIEQWHDKMDRGVILTAGSTHQHSADLEIAFTPVKHDYAGLSLQFAVECVAIFARQLPSTVAYSGPLLRPWGSLYLYLRDPSDIQIIVYQQSPEQPLC